MDDEEALWRALDTAVPRWSERRDYPRVFAAFSRSVEREQPERIEEVVRSALGRRLVSTKQPWPGDLSRRRSALGEVLGRLRQIDRVAARTALDGALRTTLAYEEEWVEPRSATRVAEAFVACFGPGATFWTDGWTRLTKALLETGVVAVDNEAAGILWITDED